MEYSGRVQFGTWRTRLGAASCIGPYTALSLQWQSNTAPTCPYNFLTEHFFQFNEFAQQEAEKIKDKGQTIVDDLIFMKQYVSNACGTIALIHSVANNAER